ncbi:uncharacterized protein LOC128276894 [Anopheles cruzii]|uniref:uncharacterized protein LOC128276894 n=1 Tax=Anopheles cruzii TaxID=68878 RepID=UPI0022EC9887|nr:uncharacterized protein LOC128276894 [Anopheles cruzii]
MNGVLPFIWFWNEHLVCGDMFRISSNIIKVRRVLDDLELNENDVRSNCQGIQPTNWTKRTQACHGGTGQRRQDDHSVPVCDERGGSHDRSDRTWKRYARSLPDDQWPLRNVHHAAVKSS